MTRRPMPLMHSLVLSLGLLPPLPERRVRVQGTAERGGTIFVDDAEIPVHEGDTAEDVAERIEDAIPLRPRPTISPFFEPACEAVPAQRPRRADPDRKAKRKAHAKVRRKGRS